MQDDTYLSLLIQISLKTLQGKAGDDMDPGFKMDLLNVKSSCCEFLEILLLNLEININKVIDILYEPMLIIMNTEIDNLDQGMEL